MSTVEVDRTPVPCLHPRARHEHGTHLAYRWDRCRCTPCREADSRRRKLLAYRAARGTHSYVDAAPAREHTRMLLLTLTVGQIERRSGVNRTAIRTLVGDRPGHPPWKRVSRATARALLAVRPDRVGPETAGLVDGTGTRRRLRALVAIGWPVSVLRARLQVSSRTTSALTCGPAEEGALVTLRLRNGVSRLFDELSLTIPAPTPRTAEARALAEARGWAPPLAWDDDTIDDPAIAPARSGPIDGGVDQVAVERAVSGDRVALTRAERWAALERLVPRGLSDREIAVRVGVSAKTVLLDRQALGLASLRPRPARTPARATS